MKKIVIVLGLLFIPSLAFAAGDEKGFDFLKSNPDFLKKFMQCGPMRAATKHKKPDEQTCEEKTALKYCEWADALPEPVQKKIELDLACDFMAGEMKGDNSDTDKEIVQSMKIAGCFEAANKGIELLRANWGKENEMRALLFFASEYTDALDVCYKQKAETEKAKPPAKAEEKKPESVKAEEAKMPAPPATDPKTDEPKKDDAVKETK